LMAGSFMEPVINLGVEEGFGMAVIEDL
jgi:hypothetical protein